MEDARFPVIDPDDGVMMMGGHVGILVAGG
jgi:hypothetical protein